VIKTNDPADELPRIDEYVHTQAGWLQANCHVMMHTVGRRFGQHAKVTLTNLLTYLPKTNDPGCSAGFAHGMLIALGPEIQKLGPQGAAASCNRAPTRYQRYSCIHGLGHAYARQFNDFVDPALASCKKLGPDDAVDCAQGVFHDYWIAVAGLDGTRRPAGTILSPRKLCSSQPDRFVRVCWYRALLERPPRGGVHSAGQLLATCSGLAGLQRSGCLTGASLIRSDDPAEQMRTCRSLAGIRGRRLPARPACPDVRARSLRDAARADPRLREHAHRAARVLRVARQDAERDHQRERSRRAAARSSATRPRGHRATGAHAPTRERSKPSPRKPGEPSGEPKLPCSVR
jgi:hypothetical protein